ncbi:MAG: DegT/DnrJ/EryC1/StrS family aminotransferase [Pseudomonadota bacterium]
MSVSRTTVEALQGKEPAVRMMHIPFLRPRLPEKEAYLGYLSQIDESRWYSNFGPLNSLLEKRLLAEYFDNLGAVTTVNNATTGLMLAISLVKRKGRYALMPSFTFPATPLAAMWCGLNPYFIDIRKDDWCMDEHLIDKALKKLRGEVAAVIPYATFGTCLDLTYYEALHDSGVPVVVDAAPCFGTTGDDGQFGKGFPGAVVFSFHATKPFGIGEGGLIYSGKPESIAMMRQGSNFGFSSERVTELQGLNAKLSEYAAAVALATLDEFPRKIQKRQAIYQCYLKQFKEIGLFDSEWSIHDSSGRIPFQFVAALCPENQINSTFVKHLTANRIESRTYFCPACHQQTLFLGFPHPPLPITEKVSQRVLSLPLWEDMTAGDVSKVVSALFTEGH